MTTSKWDLLGEEEGNKDNGEDLDGQYVPVVSSVLNCSLVTLIPKSYTQKHEHSVNLDQASFSKSFLQCVPWKKGLSGSYMGSNVRHVRGMVWLGLNVGQVWGVGGLGLNVRQVRGLGKNVR